MDSSLPRPQFACTAVCVDCSVHAVQSVCIAFCVHCSLRTWSSGAQGLGFTSTNVCHRRVLNLNKHMLEQSSPEGRKHQLRQRFGQRCRCERMTMYAFCVRAAHCLWPAAFCVRLLLFMCVCMCVRVRLCVWSCANIMGRIACGHSVWIRCGLCADITRGLCFDIMCGCDVPVQICSEHTVPKHTVVSLD